MHLKKTYGLCNPKANYKFEKRLSDYIIQNITENIFGNTMEVGEEVHEETVPN